MFIKQQDNCNDFKLRPVKLIIIRPVALRLKQYLTYTFMILICKLNTRPRDTYLIISAYVI